MDIDEVIESRNQLLFSGEDKNVGDECFKRLGVANRHIDRIIDGRLEYDPAIAKEIDRCFADVSKWLEAQP